MQHGVGAVGTEVAREGADLDPIRHLISGTTDAFNRHDAKAFARYYTPDAWLVTVRGESMTGSAEIERGLTAIFESRAMTAQPAAHWP